MTADEIDALLGRHRVGRIGCTAIDRPFVVPINYLYDDGYVYACSTIGRKIHVMREQPLVRFEVVEINGPSTWRSVIAEGVYEELTDEAQRRAAAERLVGRGFDLVPPGLVGNGLAGLVIFRLRLTERGGRFERRDA